MQRHAYLIMAHHQFDFLRELLLALDDVRNDIYLHIDQKVTDFDWQGFSHLLQYSSLFFTDRIPVHWGGYSQICCELTLLEAAVKKHYAYYHLLSGSDFPLKSQDEIHAFFHRHAGKEFLAFDAISADPPRHVRERISLYHFFRESSSLLAEPADMILSRIQRLLKVNRLKGQHLPIQKGANWFSITDAFVRYVLSQKAWIEKHFRYSVCADELFLQTLAFLSPFREQLYDPYGKANPPGNLRYVDWERGSGSNPYTFQEEDRDLLTSLPHLFARKFDHNIF